MSTVQMRIRDQSRFVPRYDENGQMRRDYEMNLRWLFAHYDELLSKYPEEYVAVYEQQVVGHAPQVEQLRNILVHGLSLISTKIPDPRAIVIRKLTKKTEQLIL